MTVKKNAVQFPILLRNIDKRTGAGAPKAPLCKGWCSAQRIKITMTAGGSHTKMYCWHEVTEGL